jgi:hypothetical protein
VSLYQVVSGSSCGSSTPGVPGRRLPTTCKLSLIRDLLDQLKCAQRELKEVTVTIAVSRLRALRSAAIERYLLDEMNKLHMSLKCEYFSKPLGPRVCSDDCVDSLPLLCRCMS